MMRPRGGPPAAWRLAGLLACRWPWPCPARTLRDAGARGASDGGAAGSGSRRQPDIHGWTWPVWFGSSFDDSPVSVNPFSSDFSSRLGHLIGNQFPTAPLDRVDRAHVASATGVVPMAPGGVRESARAPMVNDFVSKYSHPSKKRNGIGTNVRSPARMPRRPQECVCAVSSSGPDTFPGERRVQSGMDLDAVPVIPLEKKEIVPSTDKLRTPFFAHDDVPWLRGWDPKPSDNYPLTAPGDKLKDGTSPVAYHDEIPEQVAKFIHQVHDRKTRRDVVAHQNKDFASADLDNDSLVSYEEYVGELVSRQNKTALEAKQLWETYHSADSEEMTRDEWTRLARAGFSVGSIQRLDVENVLDPVPEAVAAGFWGSGAECPSGTYVSGARLKVMETAPGVDNSGLNRVGLRCTDGSEAESIEGPDGEWTQWADCPQGQRVYAIRVRSLAVSKGRDNSGINGLEFVCRATSMSAFTRLRFGGDLQARPGVVVASGPVAIGGGWSREQRCALNQAVCGLQANVDHTA
ncbi:unnamed protein product [Prorocentrum cordatum]|uniref:EF-hand domain-containing protein n=1 Tax=Prorocentrum cordatum TaxID=2364126 RepID=A0ABN9YG77_9DINO|nr:unnamed protein product [Polarella glacialis]